MKTKRSLNRNVCVVGAGMSWFGMFRDKDSKDVLAKAFQEMVSSPACLPGISSSAKSTTAFPLLRSCIWKIWDFVVLDRTIRLWKRAGPV
ncbi:MAG: hypothetical protein R6V55_17220 [Desulfovermiculus sp.]